MADMKRVQCRRIYCVVKHEHILWAFRLTIYWVVRSFSFYGIFVRRDK